MVLYISEHWGEKTLKETVRLIYTLDGKGEAGWDYMWSLKINNNILFGLALMRVVSLNLTSAGNTVRPCIFFKETVTHSRACVNAYDKKSLFWNTTRTMNDHLLSFLLRTKKSGSWDTLQFFKGSFDNRSALHSDIGTKECVQTILYKYTRNRSLFPSVSIKMQDLECRSKN